MSDDLIRARVWRLHFFTGLFLSPFFIVLALTGIIYLFKPQVEPALYQKWLEVPVGAEKVPYAAQWAQVEREFPGAYLRYMVPPKAEGLASQFFVRDGQGRQQTVYVDPYTGRTTGVQRSDLMLMQLAHDFHGELLMGNRGALLMEVCAGWGLILIATGLYIWWPFRGLWRKVLQPTLTPRPRWKALHGTLGLCLSAVILLFLLTGIPWTGVTGGYIDSLSTKLGMGAPPGFGPSPYLSEEVKGRPMVSLDVLAGIAKDLIPGTEPHISYPYDSRHAAVILWAAPHPSDSAYIHVDVYSGKVIHDFRWKDFGIIGKAISYGIALHQGTLFGVWNQALNVLLALGVLAMSLTGLRMWWLRRPKNAWLAPPPGSRVPLPLGLKLIILVFCLYVPTTGLSVLALLGLDWARGKVILNRRPL